MIVKCADRDPVFYAPLAVGKPTGSALGDTSPCRIDRFPGKHGSGQSKDQLLRLHCHSYLLVSPPLFETILSNAEMNLKVRMITYYLLNDIIKILNS